MMPVDLASILFCLLIVALVLFAFWKHGRGNPESTGQLGREVKAQREAISLLDARMEGAATRGALDLLAEQVRSLEAHSASSGEVVALEGKINVIGERVAGVAASTAETREGVKRIEAILMRGALDR